MAYGGLGLFLPSERAYKDPGTFEKVLEGEATKEARFLTHMDMFYGQLEETQREFDLTLEQQERFHEEDLEYKYWYGEKQIDLGYADIEGRKDVAEIGVGPQYGQLDLQRDRLDFEREESEFLRDLYSDREGQRQDWGDQYIDWVTGGSGSGSGSGSNAPTIYYPSTPTSPKVDPYYTGAGQNDSIGPSPGVAPPSDDQIDFGDIYI